MPFTLEDQRKCIVYILLITVPITSYSSYIKIICLIKALFVTLSKHSEDEYQQEDPYSG